MSHILLNTITPPNHSGPTHTTDLADSEEITGLSISNVSVSLAEAADTLGGHLADLPPHHLVKLGWPGHWKTRHAHDPCTSHTGSSATLGLLPLLKLSLRLVCSVSKWSVFIAASIKFNWYLDGKNPYAFQVPHIILLCNTVTQHYKTQKDLYMPLKEYTIINNYI